MILCSSRSSSGFLFSSTDPSTHLYRLKDLSFGHLKETPTTTTFILDIRTVWWAAKNQLILKWRWNKTPFWVGFVAPQSFFPGPMSFRTFIGYITQLITGFRGPPKGIRPVFLRMYKSHHNMPSLPEVPSPSPLTLESAASSNLRSSNKIRGHHRTTPSNPLRYTVGVTLATFGGAYAFPMARIGFLLGD